MDFSIWLEFEEWQDLNEDDLDNECFNAVVTLGNGQQFGINVWTFKFLQNLLLQHRVSGTNLSGKYLVVPDLLIERLDRKLVESVIDDLLNTGELPDEWFSEECR